MMLEKIVPLLRLASGIALVLGIGIGADVGTLTSDDLAYLKVTCRIRETGRQVCRKQSAEELAKLPIHMRQPDTCEHIAMVYALKISIDSNQHLNQDLHASGIWGDRPIYCDETITLEPGLHRVDVSLAPKDATAPARLTATIVHDFTAGSAVLLDANDADFVKFAGATHLGH